MAAKIQRKKKGEFREIALERIKILFNQAEEMFKQDKALSDRYVYLARQISMKYKVRIPRELKRRFCKNCHSYLVPGKNLRIRARKGRIVYYCKECRHFMRFHHK